MWKQSSASSRFVVWSKKQVYWAIVITKTWHSPQIWNMNRCEKPSSWTCLVNEVQDKSIMEWLVNQSVQSSPSSLSLAEISHPLKIDKKLIWNSHITMLMDILPPSIHSKARPFGTFSSTIVCYWLQVITAGCMELNWVQIPLVKMKDIQRGKKRKNTNNVVHLIFWTLPLYHGLRKHRRFLFI